jgi:hypothetical protein
MTEQSELEPRVQHNAFTGLTLACIAVAVLASLGGLIWSYTLNERLTHSESQLAAAQQQNTDLTGQLHQTNARLTVATESLGQSLGLTQKQLETRAQELMHRQQADSRRLENAQVAAQKEIGKQIGDVSGDVASVKTDVGGVKTDVAQTKTDLQTAQAQLQSMKGDLGMQSGLIATNHDELETLKHKGDRNYYEFTLNKGGKPQPVSTVSLELKKADSKHSRYTLNVLADDKKIEKKDRGLNEPVQFYTGRGNQLYELVVNSINKNQIVGYISAPKS